MTFFWHGINDGESTNVGKSATIADNSQELLENSEKSEKRGRGRPKGSRDSVPRKPRTIIVEEPEDAPEPPEKVKRVKEPPTKAPTPSTPSAPSAPLSPRTIFHQASATIAQMQSEREKARGDYWSEAITKSLR